MADNAGRSQQADLDKAFAIAERYVGRAMGLPGYELS
jgi:hypothetical protein